MLALVACTIETFRADVFTPAEPAGLAREKEIPEPTKHSWVDPPGGVFNGEVS